MALPELESLLVTIKTWAEDRSVPVGDGILELGPAFPHMTVVGFEPEDLTLFLTLADALPAATVAVNAPALSEEDLRIAKALAGSLKTPEDRRHYAKVATDAKAYLGRIHDLTAIAFAARLERAVVFRASSDWGEPIFELAGMLEAEHP